MARHLLILRPRLVSALAFIVPFALVGACKNAARSDEGARAESSAAHGKRFESQLAEWPKRWASVEAPVDCATLLQPAEQPVCAGARAALERLKQALPQGEMGRVIRTTGELALAAQRAAEKLRRAGIAELFPETGSRPALSAPPPKSSAFGPPSPRPSSPRPSTSALRKLQTPSPSQSADHAGHDHGVHDHGPENVHKNPTLSAILEYSRLASLALRHLATYLEHGPPNVRAEALKELIRLGKEQPRWAGLESLAREALLIETDPELKRKLDNLVKALIAERGG